MKILTNEEYSELINKIKVAEDFATQFEVESKKLNKEIEEIKKEKENIVEDSKVISSREAMKLDVKLHEKTKELKEEISKLTTENNNYKKEVEILTKAFENMGFDVKDMKEILNKLVDGIVSKNSIQLVK